MTATDELRRMLDERGVEWHGDIATYWRDADAVESVFADNALDVAFYAISPEQAIEATLGRGTCSCTTPDGTWCFVCSECGKSFPRSGLHFAHNHGEINFCPNCGAKVVDDASVD